MESALSLNGVAVRLTAERWWHIVENHDELAGYADDVLETIENPQLILRGHAGSLVAVRNYGRNRYLMVVYREVSADDGFVVTAFFTQRVDRNKALWIQP
jgi:hypothetical protein